MKKGIENKKNVVIGTVKYVVESLAKTVMIDMENSVGFVHLEKKQCD